MIELSPALKLLTPAASDSADNQILPGAFEVRIDQQFNFIRFDGLNIPASDNKTEKYQIKIDTESEANIQNIVQAADGSPFGAALKGIPMPCTLRIKISMPDASSGDSVPQISLRSITLTDKIGDFAVHPLKCYFPFSLMGVSSNGNIYPCACPGWLNNQHRYGNVRKSGIMDAWNDENMQDMRTSFFKGDYGKHCRTKVCPMLTGAQTAPFPSPAIVEEVNNRNIVVNTGPQHLLHDVDDGCNLSCPMCRHQKILINKDNVEAGMRDLDQVMATGNLEYFHTSSNGEPLLFKPFVERLKSDYFSSRDIKIGMTTNLTYFTDELFEQIKHNNWYRISVSADGCSQQTYETIRVGAKWDVFERNLINLRRCRERSKITQLFWNWVIMRPNVHELDKAILLAQDIGFDQIWFILQRGPAFGNIFEECDLEMLDVAREKIASVNGFNLPFVNILSANCLRDGSYRTLNYALAMAHFRLNEGADINDVRAQVLQSFNNLKEKKITAEEPIAPSEARFLKKIGLFEGSLEIIPKELYPEMAA